MRDTKYLVGLGVFVALLLLAECVFSVQSSPGPAANEVIQAEPLVVRTTCELIYQGEFIAAGELIEQLRQEDRQPQLNQLANIVSDYQTISERRGKARETAYRERLDELEKLQAPAPVAVAGQATADVNDLSDVNDVNNVSKLLSVIARACEFADQQQRQELLSGPFVKQTIQQAIDEAAEFESKGRWLDAYITCYRWLEAIEPDNEAYSDYAELVYKKANIVASFQDSPCETSSERFQGVKKAIFVRAIDALQFNYVNPVDYRQMAVEAIKRCELLAEVMSNPHLEPDIRYEIQDAQRTAWSAALGAVLDEVNQSPKAVSKGKFIDVFEKVLSLNAVTVELPQPVLVAQFAEASLASLDSYTAMIWPRHVQDFEKLHTGEFTGIGIEISKEKGLLTVVSLLPDTPAYESGLDAGDVIEAVETVATKDMSLICAVKNITGPAGTDVTLTIRQPGEEKTRDITITRAKITVPTIRGWQRTEKGKWLYMIDQTSKIGYVRITNFSERTPADLEKVLDELEAEGLRGLILDLRFNAGGLLASATEVADKFIEEGLIVSTRPRFGISNYMSAHKRKTHPNYPLVILINRFSASASEIVAGALADATHNRAILVGERTIGKGSVQGITHYPGKGAQLKYTMAYYHLPSGQRVESRDAIKKLGRKDWGIKPNIEVELIGDEIKKMSKVQRANDVLVQSNANRRHALLKKYTAQETLAADPQLAVGILVIKSKLVQAEKVKSEG